MDLLLVSVILNWLPGYCIYFKFLRLLRGGLVSDVAVCLVPQSIFDL